MDWPGVDEPVMLPGRPGRNRQRLYTEHTIPRHQQFYTGPDGQLLVPAGGGVHRSHSVSAQRPAPVNIINEYVGSADDHGAGRPSSVQGGVFYDDLDGRYYERPRSGSRVRRLSASPQYEMDADTRNKLKEYEEIKKREFERAEQKRIEEKLRMEKLMKDAELAEREKEDKELRKKAIEEYKIKEEEDRIKKEKQKEKEEEEFKEKMRKTLWASGYSPDQIDRMMRKAEKKGSSGGEGNSTALVMNRPTYIKVHRKHLDPETLDVYRLEWDWDDRDSSYIIIKQWVPEADQDILFEHTRRIRERKRLIGSTADFKKEKEQLLLVKRKEPKKRSSWFLT